MFLIQGSTISHFKIKLSYLPKMNHESNRKIENYNLVVFFDHHVPELDSDTNVKLTEKVMLQFTWKSMLKTKEWQTFLELLNFLQCILKLQDHGISAGGQG